jgi:sulfate adenylyltransferase
MKPGTGAQETGRATGVCVWLTGRSGAGKSTVTAQLVPLLESRGRTVSVLDVEPLLGKQWCERTSEGKLLRKGVVAREVVRHGGIAVCVTVSARRATREAVRQIVGPDHFVEVYLDPPVEVSAARKAGRKRKPTMRKRLKALLRRVRALVGGGGSVSYEPPLSPDVRIDSSTLTPADGAAAILAVLEERGVIVSPGDVDERSPS